MHHFIQTQDLADVKANLEMVSFSVDHAIVDAFICLFNSSNVTKSLKLSPDVNQLPKMSYFLDFQSRDVLLPRLRFPFSNI